ncbi:MAG: enoyl-ACP reductase FabI, partial [Candidatus Rokuibacteriota bacterium]
MALLADTTGLVMGVANHRSIAWGIAQALSAAGMRLAFTYQGERLQDNVEKLAATLPGALTLPCDVTSDAEIAAVFESLGRDFGRLHTVVHSLAYAPPDELKGEFVDTSREGSRMAHDISAYSLVGVTRAALPLLEASGAGSVIALTYYGSEKVTGNYNVMGMAKASLEASVRYLAANLGPRGVRVNAISAGAVNTLAGRGVRNFTNVLRHYAAHAPLRRNVELREIGDAAV